MTPAAELLVLLVMLAGLVGVVLPVLPGLLLIWGAGIVWAWVGGGPGRWAVAVIMTLLLVVGTVTKYVLPARSATGAGAPRRTLVAGVLGAVFGFFVIPGVGGIYLAELARLGTASAAWRSTRAVLLGVGIGMLVELATGVLMVALWGAAALAT